jgi:hypothetical protein
MQESLSSGSRFQCFGTALKHIFILTIEQHLSANFEQCCPRYSVWDPGRRNDSILEFFNPFDVHSTEVWFWGLAD